MKSNKIVTALFFACQPFIVHSQFSKPEIDLPNKEQYIYPVNPGQPGSLAGTMGELRSTHFHSGIDIRTNNQTGFPVVASKSGYISRISMAGSGYGNIIYITHPDGNTTLYAHLDRFNGAVARHVLEEQYKQKTFAIDLTFSPDEFPVTQGDTIALSGNTGSSSGPHLHFDIRDKDNFALDPLKVATFPEVPDKLPPAAEKIALKTLDKYSRINDKFGRFEFNALARSATHFSIASPILATGQIGIEIIAKDRLAPGSPFYGGVNYIEMRVDDQLVFSQAIEKVNVAETRSIYTIMDFKTLRSKGTRFYKLYIDDGNSLPFYNNSPGTGKIKIDSKKESNVLITLRDSYGNNSTVSFKLKPTPLIIEVPLLETFNNTIASDVVENTFIVTTKPCKDSTGVLKTVMYAGGNEVLLAPDYFNQNRHVHLIDLRKVLPDSIVSCGNRVVTNFKKAIPSGAGSVYADERMEVKFPEDALYDTLYFQARYSRKGDTEIYSIGDRTVPLNKSVSISLKSDIHAERKQGAAVYRLAGRGYAYVGGDWSEGRINFSTREFGEFTIIQDNIPPSIRMVYADRSGARFKISDNLSGISSYEANINGEWLLMHYDAKTNAIWSEKLIKNKALSGLLEVTVTDNAGNKKTFTRKIP